MGSTSAALIPRLQFNDCCCTKPYRNLLPYSSNVNKSIRGVLRLGSVRRTRKLSRYVCFAVEAEVGDEQREFSRGAGVGSALEDRNEFGLCKIQNKQNQLWFIVIWRYSQANKDDSSTDAGSADLSNEGVSSSQEEKVSENFGQNNEESSLCNILYPSKGELPDDKEMSIFDHLEELRQRIFVSVLAVGAAILGCFAISKELIIFLEAPVKAQGVRFLQLAPGEFFFTTLKVSGYSGLLLGSPLILYEIIAFVLPGLTRAERRFLGPIVLGSSVLFYAGIAFSYLVLTPAALNFFVSYAEGVVESLWSIGQYFEFVLVLMFSTGLSFQVPVSQFLLGQVSLVSGDQMLSIWRYVVVGVAAAVLTPSTDPLTQILLAAPLLGLYLGGTWVVKRTGR